MAYKDGKGWRGAVRHTPANGLQVRRTRFFDKKGDATKWENETRRQLELADKQQKTDLDSIGRAMTSGEWAERYLDFCEVKFCDKTYDEKKRAFRRLFRDTISPKMLANEISPAVALGHLSDLFKRKPGNTVNKDRKNLVAGWNWGIKYHHLNRNNPFQEVEKFPEIAHPRYIPPFSDFATVLEAAKPDEQLVLLCTFYTAGRKSEVFHMAFKDIDFERNTVGLWTRKRKGSNLEFDTMPMCPSLKKLLKKRKVDVGGAKQVFGDLQHMANDCHNRWLTDLCETTGIRKFGFHGLRHLAASIGIDKKVKPTDIQQLLRHKSLTTTVKYIHRMQKDNDAIDALDKVMKDSHGIFG
jgi:integrase